MQWNLIDPLKLDKSPFQMIGKEWMLITAQKQDKTVNTMTASWGGMGVLWGKNVVFAFVRPQRFTKEFIDEAQRFTLTFFDEKYKKELGYLGKVSGKDENKIQKAGFTVQQIENAPVFEQANTAILCRTLYTQKIDPANFHISGLDEQWYPQKDYHIMYIAEVEGIYTKK